MHCKTVKVKRQPCSGNPSGVVTINASDFVEGQDELYTEGEETVVVSSESKETKTTTSRVSKAAKGPVQPWAKTE